MCIQSSQKIFLALGRPYLLLLGKIRKPGSLLLFRGLRGMVSFAVQNNLVALQNKATAKEKLEELQDRAGEGY